MPKQTTQDLGRQIIDQVVILIILLAAWFFRDSLGPLWTKVLITVAVVLLGVDYFIHSPRGKKLKKK